EAQGLNDTLTETGVDDGKSEKPSEMNIEFNGERYVVSLPWKIDCLPFLKDNYALALGRLNTLYSRLKDHPELLKEYDAVFRDQLEKGIIEKVNISHDKGQSKIHFLSHHCVIRRNHDTTKLRAVFDGSAKAGSDSLSLNDCLYQGDNYLPQIFDNLLRFRSHGIGITADIEKAFLQVEIKECDRDAVRFLWFENAVHSKENLIQYRYKRLVFGLKPSPAILGATLLKHVSQYESQFPAIVQVLKRLYCDDLSCSTDKLDDASEIFHKSKEILSEGGFNLRKWKTNDKLLSKEFATTENSTHQSPTAAAKENASPKNPRQPEPGTKVLGVNWDSESDDLFYDLSSVVEFAQSLKPTKRSLLKICAKIYDPFGALSVYTIKLKVLFQEFCLKKLGWDEELQGKDRERYEKFVSEIKGLNGIRGSRCLF
ncbi:MAG: reverse transcriptase domain-containing protein, partial [Bacteroidota bacterium]